LRYPKRANLRSLYDGISKDVVNAEETLKKHSTEYNEVRHNVSAIERKETGTLLVKPLGQFVQPTDIVEGSYLTTLLVVVPRSKEKEFLETYETMEQDQYEKEQRLEKDREERDMKTKKAAEDKRAAAITESQDFDSEVKTIEATEDADEEEKTEAEPEKKSDVPFCFNVVPKSARKLTNESDDAEYMLYRIVLLKKGIDRIRTVCRERRYTIRPFKFDLTEEKQQLEEKIKLGKRKKNLWNFVVLFCKTQYSDVFSSWIHIKAMRVFVEAVLRYGLPANFSAFLIKPKRGAEKTLRETLSNVYAKLDNANLSQALDSTEVDLSGFGTDFYPYVYLPLQLE